MLDWKIRLKQHGSEDIIYYRKKLRFFISKVSHTPPINFDDMQYTYALFFFRKLQLKRRGGGGGVFLKFN